MQVVGTKWACSNRLADDCPCEPPNGFKAIGQLLLSVGTPLNQSEQDVLYQLRNALLHSFGLYSESKNAVYRFFLTDSGAGALVTSHGLGRYFVDLLVLKNYFDSAVGEYKQLWLPRRIFKPSLR